MRVVIVWSSTEKDEGHLRELRTHLDVLARSAGADLWHSGAVPAGEMRAEMVRAEIERADVVLLLVSPELLTSDDYLLNQDLWEAATSLEGAESLREGEIDDRMDTLYSDRRGRVVVPILVRACLQEVTPLRHLLTLPRGGIPVSQGADKDAVWTEVVREIRDRLPDPRERDRLQFGREEPRRRERVTQVMRVAQLRFPDAEIEDLPAARPFAGVPADRAGAR